MPTASSAAKADVVTRKASKLHVAASLKIGHFLAGSDLVIAGTGA